MTEDQILHTCIAEINKFAPAAHRNNGRFLPIIGNQQFR
jgi:hypothetical protein